jgi:predicted nucleic acid-binding protein
LTRRTLGAHWRYQRSTGAKSITAIWRAHGEEAATAKLQAIAQLPIQVFDVDMEMARQAASLKAQYKLPYADFFAAALAQARKATLVTSDKDFARAETVVKILWV